MISERTEKKARYCLMRALTLVWVAVVGILSSALATELEVIDGHRNRLMMVVSDEIGFAPVKAGETGIRVIRNSAAIARMSSSPEVIRRNGAMPVLYPVGMPRNEANQRFGTEHLIVRTNGQEPEAGWFSPRPERVEKLVIAGLEVEGLWRLAFSTPWHALQAFANFETRESVISMTPELAKRSYSRLIPNDPRFSEQYQLHNNNPFLIDLNIISAWDNYTGTGINIGILDNGVNASHVDLNVRTDIDVNYNAGDPNNGTSSGFSHGTGVAGIAAARGNNGIGVAGAAFGANIVSIKLTAGLQTDSTESSAFSHQNGVIQIKNNSWGPSDDGKTLEGPGPLAQAALAQSTSLGRNGLGTIHVWAGGNGGVLDDTNKDGYANSIYTIAVGAINMGGTHASYSESSTSLLGVVPVANGILSTNGQDGYFVTGGTSAAAPLTSGVVALMLQANSQLGWRDVQDILIRSARTNDSGNSGWITNTAGLDFNRKYGAGLLDATGAVNLALDPNRQKLGPQTKINILRENLGITVPDNSAGGTQISFNVSASDFSTEHVVLKSEIFHNSRGDLDIEVTSPTGTTSKLITKHDDFNAHYIDWPFMSLFYWGENPDGNWTVTIRDLRSGNIGQVEDLELIIYGSGKVAPPDPDPQVQTFTVPDQEVVVNSNQKVLNIVNFVGLPSSEIQSMSVAGNSNPGLLEQASTIGTSFAYKPAAGETGSTSITLEVLANNGVTHVASFLISVLTPDTIKVTVPAVSVKEDSGDHSVNLLPFPGVTSASELDSLVITGNTNPGVIQNLSVVNGTLQFSTVSNNYGATDIFFTAASTSGQPFEGSIKITVEELPDIVFVPNQFILENSGLHIIDIVNYINLGSQNDLESLTITGNTSPSVLKKADIINGQFHYEPTDDAFGVTAITFSATSTSQKTFHGSFGITVSPIKRQVVIPDQEVLANAPQQILNIVPYLGLDGAHQIKSMSIAFQTNPDLFAAVVFQAGQFIWHADTGKTGVNIVTFDVTDNLGRPYTGSIKVTVKVKNIPASLPDVSVVENSGLNSFNVIEPLGLSVSSELLTFKVVGNTAPDLIASTILSGGQFFFSTVPDKFGKTTLSFEAETTSGLLYFGDFDISITPEVDLINFPAQSISEGTVNYSIAVAPILGLGGGSEIADFRIAGQSNAGLFSDIRFDAGALLITSEDGLFGNNTLAYEAQASNGQPYSGVIPVSVIPKIYTSFVPNLEIVENSGAHSLNMLPFLALNHVSELASLTLVGSTQPDLFSQSEFDSGQFLYTPANDRFGVSAISFEAVTTAGRPYAGSFSVSITPLTHTVEISSVEVTENSGQHAIDLVAAFGASSFAEFSAMQLDRQSNPQLFSSVAMDNGLLTFIPGTDIFGVSTIFISAQSTGGRPYFGQVVVNVVPAQKDLLVPNQVFVENSGPHTIKIASQPGGENIEPDSVLISEVTNPGLFDGTSVQLGDLLLALKPDSFGTSNISFSASGGDGRPYSGIFNVTVTPLTYTFGPVDVVVEENSAPQVVDLLPHLSISDAGQLSSAAVTGVSDQSIVSGAQIVNGQLLFTPVQNRFGGSEISFNAMGVNGRPYSGVVAVSITPQTRQVLVNNQVHAENSNQHSVRLIDFFNLDPGDSMDDIIITQVSNESLFTGLLVFNGELFYEVAEDQFGDSTIEFTGVSRAGRPYRGIFAVTIIPTVRDLVLPDRVVLENGGPVEVDILTPLEISSVSSIGSIEVVTQSNPELVAFVQIDPGGFTIHLNGNKFGESLISFEVVLKNQRTFEGMVKLVVEPSVKQTVLKSLLVEPGQSPIRIPMTEAISKPGLSGFEITQVSGTEYVSSVSIDGQDLVISSGTQKSGDVLVSMTAQGEFGRPHILYLPMRVDAFQYWQELHFGSEILNNPELELSLWGNDADPDADGWSNIAEYSFGGNPRKREDKSQWIRNGLEKVGESAYQLLELNIRNNDDRLIVIPQVSTDQVNWINTSLDGDAVLELVHTLTDTSNFRSIILKDRFPVKPADPRYIRIQFSRP